MRTPSIAINLLPVEFATKQVRQKKFYKVQVVSIAALLIMAFMASITVALRVLQSQNLTSAQTRLAQAEDEVLNLKSKEAAVVVLKNRLDAINRVHGVSSKQLTAYSLIDGLLPQDIPINSLSIDVNGNILLSFTVSSPEVLDNLMTSLTSKDRNFNLVDQVEVESVARSRDGLLRVSLKIKAR